MQNIFKSLLFHWIHAMPEFLPTSRKKHSGKTSILPWQLHSPNFGNDCSDLTLNLLNLCTWLFPTCHTSWKLPLPLSAHWWMFYWTGSSSSFPQEPSPLKAPGLSENGTNRKGEQNNWFTVTEQLSWAALSISLSGQTLGSRTVAKQMETVIACVSQ